MALTSIRRVKPGRLVTSVCAAALLAAGIVDSADASGARPARAAGAATAVTPTAPCKSLVSLDLGRLDTVVEEATEVTRDEIGYCAVTGYISPQTRYEVLLPTATWTGDYLQQGC